MVNGHNPDRHALYCSVIATSAPADHCTCYLSQRVDEAEIGLQWEAYIAGYERAKRDAKKKRKKAAKRRLKETPETIAKLREAIEGQEE